MPPQPPSRNIGVKGILGNVAGTSQANTLQSHWNGHGVNVGEAAEAQASTVACSSESDFSI